MKTYDASHGSHNRYTIEPRHQLIPTCMHCGEFTTITVDGGEFWAFTQEGKHVQHAFPRMSADIRELFISGTHPECWEAFVGPEPKE